MYRMIMNDCIKCIDASYYGHCMIRIARYYHYDYLLSVSIYIPIHTLYRYTVDCIKPHNKEVD